MSPKGVGTFTPLLLEMQMEMCMEMQHGELAMVAQHMVMERVKAMEMEKVLVMVQENTLTGLLTMDLTGESMTRRAPCMQVMRFCLIA